MVRSQAATPTPAARPSAHIDHQVRHHHAGWSLGLRELPGWGWITASGVVTLIAGIVFVAGWPAYTVYLLGMMLAVDLTFQGAMAIGCGFALKELAK